MKNFIIFIFLCTPLFLRSEIHEIKNIEQISSYLKEGQLIIFDLDNTIMQTEQLLGSDQWFANQMHNYQDQGFSKEKAFEKTYHEWFKIISITNMKPVEPITAEFVKKIQKKYPVIALTSRSFDINYPTFSQLKSIDVTFTNMVSQLLLLEEERYIVFKNGIIFANGNNKGKSLAKFLQKINLIPKEIIFVDDKFLHLREMEDFCKESKILFIGLRYGYLDEQVKKFDRKKAELQLNHFLKILSDLD